MVQLELAVASSPKIYLLPDQIFIHLILFRRKYTILSRKFRIVRSKLKRCEY